jgi:hypothetical protein
MRSSYQSQGEYLHFCGEIKDLREIHTARRVTHPNVCRIFEVLGRISRIVVTQTDGKMHTVDFNAKNGQPLSLTFGPPSR